MCAKHCQTGFTGRDKGDLIHSLFTSFSISIICLSPSRVSQMLTPVSLKASAWVCNCNSIVVLPTLKQQATKTYTQLKYWTHLVKVCPRYEPSTDQ